MTSARFVYNDGDGGITIGYPTDEAIRAMAAGGYWGDCPRGWLDLQIERNIADGHDPDASAAYVRAMQFGGLGEIEAVRLIARRDAPKGALALEIMDRSDFPSDRWFRNAWTRSHNGGPISISIPKARKVQWSRLRQAVAHHNAHRLDDFECWRDEINPDWDDIRHRISLARDETDIRAVWLAELRGI